MKIHISEILPTCDSELTLTNIGSHNVEHVIDLIRTLVKITEQKHLGATENLIEDKPKEIKLKDANRFGEVVYDSEKDGNYSWQEGDWHYINTTNGKRYLRVRNLPALLEDTEFLKYAEPIEITDSMLSQNGWQYKYGFFEGPFKISANLSSPTSSKRVYRAILEDGRVLPIKYISDIQHILTELGNSKIIIPEDE